jgi:ABC-type branched-subunit amino acid transport system substrate-binding protein
MRQATTRNYLRTGTVAIALGALTTACSSGGAASPAGTSATCSRQVTIGAEESLSGDFSALGAAIIGSTAVAVHDVNRTGFTVNGECYTFKLVQADAQSTPAGAALGATKLTQAGAKFVFGPTETPEALGAQPGIKAAGAMWFTGSTVVAQSLFEGATTSDPATYGLSYGVLEPAALLSQNLADEAQILLPGAKTAALLLPGNVTSAPYVKYLTQYLRQKGITITKSVLYSPTATDYTADLTSIKATSPDILITGTSSTTEVQTVAGEMETLGGVAKALMATIGTPQIGLTGNNGQPLTFPFAYANTGSVNVVNPPKTFTAYLGVFKAVAGAAPATPYLNLSTTQWPAVELLAQAMSKAGTVTDMAKIGAALALVSLTNDPGFPGKSISISSDHLLGYPQTVGTVIDGKAVAQQEVPAN